MYHIEVTKSASDWHSWWDGHKANQNRQRYPFMFEEEKFYFFKLETLSQMEEENAIHQDIVQGDFDDTYK